MGNAQMFILKYPHGPNPAVFNRDVPGMIRIFFFLRFTVQHTPAAGCLAAYEESGRMVHYVFPAGGQCLSFKRFSTIDLS